MIIFAQTLKLNHFILKKYINNNMIIINLIFNFVNIRYKILIIIIFYILLIVNYIFFIIRLYYILYLFNHYIK